MDDLGWTMLVLWIITIAVIAWGYRPRRPRRLYVRGLGRTMVGAGNEMWISARADCDFRPTQLLVPSSSAEGFLIMEAKVGKITMLNTVGALPASMFSEESDGFLLSGPLARSGDFVSVMVKNSGEEDGEFVGAVMGEVPWRWWEWLFFRPDCRWRSARARPLRRKYLLSSLYGKMGRSKEGATHGK